MRWFLIVFYILFIAVLQTVVFARLSVFGVSPDLILVSVVGFAVLDQKQRSTVIAAGAGFIQDILSFGVYLHTITRVVISSLISAVKESFAGSEYFLAAVFVALFTPLALVVEGGFHAFFGGRHIDLIPLLSSILIATLYNLLMVPFLFPIIKRLTHG